MPLSDMIEEKIVSCTPDTPIHKVADLMKTEDVGAIVVLKDEKPVGICTDRDLVLRCICDQLSTNENVDKVMTKAVETVSFDAGIQDVIKLMRDKEIRRVCIVDQSGKAKGLVSFGDVVGLLAKELSDISTTTPVDVAA